MTGRWEGKKILAGPQAASYEARQAASVALCEIADRMMRGAQSLMRKAARTLDVDPAATRKLISDLRRYGNSEMPCAEEMTLVEALLRGLPEDQCQNEREKKRDDKEKKQQEAHAACERRRSRMHGVQEEIRRILAMLEGREMSPCDHGQASRILWDLLEGRRPNRPRVQHHNGANVVEGPWGEAS